MVKPGTQPTKSTVAKTGDKLATSRLSISLPIVTDTFDFVADLLPVCRKSTFAGSFDCVDPDAVDIVSEVEHVRLGRLRRKWVIFVAGMSNDL